MPGLTVFTNPPEGEGEVVSERVYEIRYRHIEDGANYKHSFRPGVCAELLPDGSVRLYHRDGKPLMREF
jgi:hypothetical protein